jgi:indolepyruvate ferredoxin oxidoreductase alpha subunit
MLEVRIRACHVHGRFAASDNVRPSYTLRDAMENPRRQTDRIVLPPASYLHEKEKIEKRWPAAVKFIEDTSSTSSSTATSRHRHRDAGRDVQHHLARAGACRLWPTRSGIRAYLYVMNVTYPLDRPRAHSLREGKRAILIVEEGQPEFLEQAINTIFRRADVQTRIEGKGMLPMAGEYTGGVVRDGVKAFVRKYQPDAIADAPPSNEGAVRLCVRAEGHRRPCASAPAVVLHRLSGAADLHRAEAGRARARHASRELRHRMPPVLDPAAVQHRRDHDGLRPRRRGRGGVQHQIRQARDRVRRRRRLLAQRAHLLDRQRGVQQVGQCHVIVDNGYTSATGGQDILSSTAATRSARRRTRSRKPCAASASNGCAR